MRTCLPDELRRMQTGGSSLAARLSALRAGGEISVEIAGADDLGLLALEWRDLLQRADVPNVFCAPAVLQAAARSGTRIVVLLAWEGEGGDRRLAGIWPFSPGRPKHGVLPRAVMCAPVNEHAYCSAPVIDRNHVDKVLAAMLDAIAHSPALPNTIMLSGLSEHACAALDRVLAARGSEPCHLGQTRRPVLGCGADPDAYLQSVFSSSTRKKLRQYRRRLGERGDLQLSVAQAPDEVADAAERFLTLEAQGWKGRRGTALLSHEGDAEFARHMLRTLAAQNDVTIYSLTLDGRPVSMQIVLRAGDRAFTWKTAYDEALADVSPGMLLFEDYTKALLSDPAIRMVDSCAYDETSFMASWGEREVVVDLMFDARRDPPPQARWCAAVNRGYRASRARAKGAWHSARAKLKRVEKVPVAGPLIAFAVGLFGGL